MLGDQVYWKCFHPDVAVLVHIDEVTKLNRFTSFIVKDRSGRTLVGEIGIHCRLQLPQLKRMVCCTTTLRMFYDGGINVVDANCNTRS